MSGSDLVRQNGQTQVDAMELRNRSGKLPQSEVRDAIAHWQQVQKNMRRIPDMDAARVAGDIVSQLQDLEKRADPGS